MTGAEPALTVRSLPETVAVIVGGTSGIGLETAGQLAEAGVRRIVVLRIGARNPKWPLTELM